MLITIVNNLKESFSLNLKGLLIVTNLINIRKGMQQ